MKRPRIFFAAGVFLSLLCLCLTAVLATADMGLNEKTPPADWLTFVGGAVSQYDDNIPLSNQTSLSALGNNGTLVLRTAENGASRNIHVIPTSVDREDYRQVLSLTAYHPWIALNPGKLPIYETSNTEMRVPIKANAGADYGFWGKAQPDQGYWIVSEDQIPWYQDSGTEKHMGIRGPLYVAKVANYPKFELRYGFGAGSDATNTWDSLQGIVFSNPGSEMHYKYSGLLEKGKSLTVGLMNWGVKTYTTDQAPKQVWLGETSLAVTSIAGKSVKLESAFENNQFAPAFGNNWTLDLFQGDNPFVITLYNEGRQEHRIQISWDDAYTYERGSYQKATPSGQIDIQSLKNISTLTSRDLSKRSFEYLDNFTNVQWNPLMIQEDYRKYSNMGVKGLVFELPYTPSAPLSGDKKRPLGVACFEIKFPVDEADLRLAGDTGNETREAILSDIGQGKSLTEAVVRNIRLNKYFGTSGRDLVSLVDSHGKSLSDFFTVVNRSTDPNWFAVTIGVKIAVVDGLGPNVVLKEGYFLIKDKKEDAVVEDPLLFVRTKGSPINGGGGGDSGGGCDAGFGALAGLAAIVAVTRKIKDKR